MYGGNLTSSSAYGNMLTYDLFHILLAPDVERYATSYEFVGHHTHRPDVDLLVVGLSPHNLRRKVQRGSASGASHTYAMDSPPEIADLHYTLH